MAFGSNTCTAVSDYLYWNFGESGFEYHSVADNAYIGAYSQHLYLLYVLILSHSKGDIHSAESDLLKLYAVLTERLIYCIFQHPAFCSSYAVRNREILSLLSIHVVFVVSVEGSDYFCVLVFLAELFNICGNIVHNSGSFGISQSACCEVLLHIDNN